MALILSNTSIANNIWLMKLAGNYTAEPGQFYMLKADNAFLPRPISIFDIDDEGISFLYQSKGDGTQHFSSLQAGNHLELFGPLGEGFDMKKLAQEPLTLIGGGIGIAPLYYTAKVYKQLAPNNALNIYLGYSHESYATEAFNGLTNDLHVSVGGLIPDLVDYTQAGNYACCGPHIMMEAIHKHTTTHERTLYVSLENHMACGVGACLGCTCKTKEGNKRICKEGPVFLSSDIFSSKATMEKLQLDFLGMNFNNPLVMASGTFGFGKDYTQFFDVNILGGISSKGLTLRPQPGNSGQRIHETAGGLMNSIGLENPGVAAFIDRELPYMNSIRPRTIVNFGAHSIDDFVNGLELLNQVEVDAVELNISCPNVKEGGMAFGVCPTSAHAVVKAATAVSKHPLIVKLSPNAPSIVEVAAACEEAGANALALVNTFLGFAIDVNKRKPIFDNIYAGLSGPAIKPIALRMVHQVSKQTSLPILAYGGVGSANDVLEFMMAGATLVGIGSAIFPKPTLPADILNDLTAYCDKHNINSLKEIIGII